MSSEVLVFVGCAPDWADAESQAVLEHSLRSRTDRPIKIVWMMASSEPDSPWAGWDMTRWATPFSGFRWSVPEVCGFHGRAIYMDSDVIVLGDIAELWEFDLGRDAVAAVRSPSKFCVTLWDCARARDHLARLSDLRKIDGHERQTQYFRHRPGLVAPFGTKWNHLDIEDGWPPDKLLHYTDLTTQPHMRHALSRLVGTGLRHWYDGPMRPHPRPEVVELFEREYAAAIAAGYTPDRYRPKAVFGALKKRAMVNYQSVKK